MPRPFKHRIVCGWQEGAFLKPQGVPLRDCEVINLQFDELEALRQAHLLGKTQEGGAAEMGISRSTFQRILESAHQKVSRALVEQDAIKIEGGPVISDARFYRCSACEYEFQPAFGSGRPEICPECEEPDIQRITPERGYGRGGRGGGHGFRGGKQ